MNQDEFQVKDWFPDDLSDETAYALHLFLEQFTCCFEQAYYAQIRRYVHHDPGEIYREDDGDDIQLPWEENL